MLWLYRSSCRIQLLSARSRHVRQSAVMQGDFFQNALATFVRDYATVQAISNEVNAEAPRQICDAMLEKYSEKLEIRMKQLGVHSMDELKKKSLSKQSVQPSKDGNSVLEKQPCVSAAMGNGEKGKDSLDTTCFKSHNGHSGISRSLGDIFHIEKLESQQMDVATIESLWRLYHMEKFQHGSLCAVIPVNTFQTLRSRALAYPMFIFPIIAPSGIEWYVMQFSMNRSLFTSLREYQMLGDNARPYLILQHFTELQNSKGIILMQGVLQETNDGKKLISVEDARTLVNLFQYYYVLAPKKRFEFVETFNSAPNQFNYEQFLEDFNNITFS